MTKPNHQVDEIISNDLDLSSHMAKRHDASFSRSDLRRAVEDLLEVRRYKEMHEDF